jgi:hypothetical protein
LIVIVFIAVVVVVGVAVVVVVASLAGQKTTGKSERFYC